MTRIRKKRKENFLEWEPTENDHVRSGEGWSYIMNLIYEKEIIVKKEEKKNG